MIKDSFPDFLIEIIEPKVYYKWLTRKAAAHVKRDLGRERPDATGAAYRDAIHAAVLQSNGRDAYTGEDLDWKLISTYENSKSKEGRHAYKSSFARLPTLDHVEAASKSAAFKICGWRTNDAKGDLSFKDFIELCEKVLRHAEKDALQAA